MSPWPNDPCSLQLYFFWKISSHNDHCSYYRAIRRPQLGWRYSNHAFACKTPVMDCFQLLRLPADLQRFACNYFLLECCDLLIVQTQHDLAFWWSDNSYCALQYYMRHVRFISSRYRARFLELYSLYFVSVVSVFMEFHHHVFESAQRYPIRYQFKHAPFPN